jgi:hypothetical protein
MNNKKKFFLKLIVLAATLFFVDSVAGLLLKHLFYKQKSGKYFTTTHALIGANEEILVFGNSHASQHFDAPLMKEKIGKTTFNFGNQGQGFLYTYTLVRSALSYSKPKLIILDVDYDVLRFDKDEYQRLSIYLPYYHFNSFIDSAIDMIGNEEEIKAKSFLFRYNSILGYTLLNTYHPSFSKSMKSLGYDSQPGTICGEYADLLLKQTETDITDYKIDSIKVHELITLIKCIKAKKINLLVTTTPLFNFNHSIKNPYKKKLNEILTTMNVDYLDYGNSTDFKGRCELFNDNSHLNSQGADRWTTICIDHIKAKNLSMQIVSRQ